MKPCLGITMGDPAGIGPEVIVKALARPGVRRLCCPLVIGSAGIVRRTFVDISDESPADVGADTGSPGAFSLGGLEVRQVTSRNAPNALSTSVESAALLLSDSRFLSSSEWR